jgi:hypothetical protein
MIDVHGAEVSTRLWQVVDAHLLREHGARPYVGYLQCHCSSVFIFFFDKVSDLIVNRDGEAGIDIEAADEIIHGDDEEMEVVDARGLDGPIDAGCHEATFIDVTPHKGFSDACA